MKREGIVVVGPSVEQSKAKTLDIDMFLTPIFFLALPTLAQPGYFLAISKHF